ncbi:hypothetical protein BJF79_01475 [Actinomadura sp. CNU-125]|uniref:hypothetical protein n=1 Tax=Actinomadura sp. CNU-125 TaxID=1904961 RepID=UPI0009636C1F|nr:hypothetical protein [Actinomadura sp. CNU-125]OLT27305.1 hypothetical protein BJF79_01475 [Actinomadura sp. CNU-125]
MNGTEERLKDALDAVAETLQPGDVPPPRFAEARRARTVRRFVPMAAAGALGAAASAASSRAASSAGRTGRTGPPHR